MTDTPAECSVTCEEIAPRCALSRTERLMRALTWGYGYQILVITVGFWLTPFLLHQIGVAEYGTWLMIGQVLALLSLLDLGVVAIVPRDVAAADGEGLGWNHVSDVVSRANWLILHQWPFVAIVAALVGGMLVRTHPHYLAPTVVILGTVTLLFPARLFPAVLTGLQDLSYIAALQTVSWTLTTVLTVAGVLGGLGLWALISGWFVGQVVLVSVAYWRLRSRFPSLVLRGPRPSWKAMRPVYSASLWTSLRQVAQLLLNGVDLMILGWTCGPEAVVLYTCTTKLVGVLVNQPYVLATSAVPGMTELHATGQSDRFWQASQALGLGLMCFSGCLAIAIVPSSEAFITRWVGPEQFGGGEIVIAAVIGMLARHWHYSLGMTIFSIGHDRLLSVLAVIDGCVLVVFASIGTLWLGPIGVPLASLLSVLVTQVPVSVAVLAASTGRKRRDLLGAYAGWGIGFLLIFAAVSSFALSPYARQIVPAAIVLVAAGAAYAAVVARLLEREPLTLYRDRVFGRYSGLLRWTMPRASVDTSAG